MDDDERDGSPVKTTDSRLPISSVGRLVLRERQAVIMTIPRVHALVLGALVLVASVPCLATAVHRS